MVRLLDLNQVSYLHSQSIYHTVAYCTTEASSGTVIILTPKESYASIGYHQSLENEIDVEYCREKGIPIIRREVGGGAVYLDKDQLFFQCIFPKDSVPIKLDNLYTLFLQPAVNTYRSLGVDACYLPGADINVAGRKICGNGAGRIEDAAVVVGNILFDFNYNEMARILRVPSETFRDKIYDSMQVYLTTLRRELGYIPDRQRVKNILIAEFEKVLGVSLQRGDLTPDEHRRLAEMDKKLTDRNWLYEKGGKVDNWIKISADVKVKESTYPFPEGLLRIILRVKGDTIDDIVITGDLTLQPLKDLQHLKDRLIGHPLKTGPLLKTVESFYTVHNIQSLSIQPEDIVRTITGENN